VYIENSPIASDLPFDNGTTEGGIGVDRNERSQLASMVRSRSIPAALVVRSRIVLAAAARDLSQ
jgi:hypothetical protein